MTQMNVRDGEKMRALTLGECVWLLALINTLWCALATHPQAPIAVFIPALAVSGAALVVALHLWLTRTLGSMKDDRDKKNDAITATGSDHSVKTGNCVFYTSGATTEAARIPGSFHIGRVTVLCLCLSPLSALAQAPQEAPPDLVACTATSSDLQRAWMAARADVVALSREVDRLKKQTADKPKTE